MISKARREGDVEPQLTDCVSVREDRRKQRSRIRPFQRAGKRTSQLISSDPSRGVVELNESPHLRMTAEPVRQPAPHLDRLISPSSPRYPGCPIVVRILTTVKSSFAANSGRRPSQYKVCFTQCSATLLPSQTTSLGISRPRLPVYITRPPSRSVRRACPSRLMLSWATRRFLVSSLRSHSLAFECRWISYHQTLLSGGFPPLGYETAKLEIELRHLRLETDWLIRPHEGTEAAENVWGDMPIP